MSSFLRYVFWQIFVLGIYRKEFFYYLFFFIFQSTEVVIVLLEFIGYKGHVFYYIWSVRIQLVTRITLDYLIKGSARRLPTSCYT
jgi:hypothetical protein